MSIHVTVIGDDKFKAKLKEISKEVPGEVRDEMTTIVSNIRNTIIKSMRDTPKDTSKKYSVSAAGVKRKIYHNPSFPGNAPAIMGGKLVGAIRIRIARDEAEVGDALTLYGKLLEDGTKKMKARPWLKPAIDHEERYSPIQERIFEVLEKAASK